MLYNNTQCNKITTYSIIYIPVFFLQSLNTLDIRVSYRYDISPGTQPQTFVHFPLKIHTEDYISLSIYISVQLLIKHFGHRCIINKNCVLPWRLVCSFMFWNGVGTAPGSLTVPGMLSDCSTDPAS